MIMAYATFEPQLDLARLEALIPAQDYVVLNIINYARRLIPAVKRSGKELWCDREGKKLVVCTHGRQGSTALTPGGRWVETPIVPGYTVRDTNGAGDAFFAGFLFGHSRRYPLEQCLQLASITGALCVTSEELAAPGLSPMLLETEHRRHFG